jgi:SpoVK/Ycf46/Vps4 family AAA+-type ATPase
MPGGEIDATRLSEVLSELESMVGLRSVKDDIRELCDFVQIQIDRQREGLPIRDISLHMAFTGNPGTGKTTVARLLGQALGALRVVSTGHLMEVERSQLVADYVGQTAPKTRAVVEMAVGGVLFIDEAYSLAARGQEDFGHEAIDTLVKVMEDLREDLVVIVAGYPAPMGSFFASNPGLASRFRREVTFPDYSNEELVTIFVMLATGAGYEPDAEAIQVLRSRLEAEPRGPSFGNARLVRNWFEDAIAQQASPPTKTFAQPGWMLRPRICHSLRIGFRPAPTG